MQVEVYRENLVDQELSTALEKAYEMYVLSTFKAQGKYFSKVTLKVNDLDDIELLVNAIAKHIVESSGENSFTLSIISPVNNYVVDVVVR